MSLLLRLDPTLFWIIAIPTAIAAAAWALSISCSLCAIEVPQFWHSVLIVFMLVVGNLVVNAALNALVDDFNTMLKVTSALMTTIFIYSASLSIGIATACTVTMLHVGLCFAIYVGMTTIDGVLMAGSVFSVPLCEEEA